jgi:hypothetical protein
MPVYPGALRLARHSGAENPKHGPDYRDINTRSKTVVLEQEAIPRAAVPNCTNHFSVVNTLGESVFDSACSIEGFQLFGGEFQIQTGEIILQLRYLPRKQI